MTIIGPSYKSLTPRINSASALLLATLEIDAVSYNPALGRLIIVFDEDSDGDSINFGLSHISTTPPPTTHRLTSNSLFHITNGNVLTIVLASDLTDILDGSFSEDSPIPSLTFRAGSVIDADGEETNDIILSRLIALLEVDAAPAPPLAPAPDPVSPPDDDPLQLSNAQELLIEDLTLVVGETREVSIEGGSPPFFVARERSGTTQSVIVSGSTLHVTGATAGQVSLRIRDIRGAFTFLPVRVTALPPVLNPEADDGTGTEAVFRGGASSDGGDSYSRDGSFPVGEVLDISFSITPRSADVGERANVVVMARSASAPEVVWLLTPSGLVLYDGETPAPYIENLTLEADNFVDLTPEPITLTMAEVGNWELFIGYQLVGGELFYHPEEPLQIEVVE